METKTDKPQQLVTERKRQIEREKDRKKRRDEVQKGKIDVAIMAIIQSRDVISLKLGLTGVEK